MHFSRPGNETRQREKASDAVPTARVDRRRCIPWARRHERTKFVRLARKAKSDRKELVQVKSELAIVSEARDSIELRGGEQVDAKRNKGCNFANGSTPAV